MADKRKAPEPEHSRSAAQANLMARAAAGEEEATARVPQSVAQRYHAEDIRRGWFINPDGTPRQPDAKGRKTHAANRQRAVRPGQGE